MEFSKFYYLSEEDKKDTRRNLWKKLFKIKAFTNLDFKFDKQIVKNVDENSIEKLLGYSTILLYSSDPKFLRLTLAKEFASKLKSNGIDYKFFVVGERPVVEIFENKVKVLRFEFKDNIMNKIRAVEFENAIVEIWNGQKVSRPLIKDAASNIVEQLRKKIKSNIKAEHIGSKQLPPDSLSSFWKTGSFFPDRTPKPDFIIENHRISLKMGTNAQLCSSKIIGGEGNRLVMSSLQGTKVPQKIKDEIEEMISLRNKRPSGSRKTYLLRGNKEESKFDIDYIREQHKKLTELLNDGCKDTEFKRNFIFEAMTGTKKFVDEKGQANFMLAAPLDGSFINFKSVREINLNKLVEESKLYVSFKSNFGIPYSVLRVGTPVHQESQILLNYFEERANLVGINHKILNEGIKDWITKVVNILKELLKKGLDAIMKFFGIEIDKLEVEQSGYNFLEV